MSVHVLKPAVSLSTLATIRVLGCFPTFLGRVTSKLKQQLVSDDIASGTYILVVSGTLPFAMITIALLRNVSSAMDDIKVDEFTYPQFLEPVAQMVVSPTNT